MMYFVVGGPLEFHKITINALSWSAKPAGSSVGSMQFRCWHVSSPFCDVIECRACKTFKNYRQHFVISRHVGGLLGDNGCHDT